MTNGQETADDQSSKTSVELAELDAFAAWSEVIRNGRVPHGALEMATYLEQSLMELFGVTDEEAWQASNVALRALTNPEFRERAEAKLKQLLQASDGSEGLIGQTISFE